MNLDVSFASFLTPPGVIAAAAVITTLVQLIKSVFPAIDAKVSGALMAFVGSAVLYVFTAVAVGVPTFDSGLLVFLAWLSCATSSVGIKSATNHVQEVTAPAVVVTARPAAPPTPPTA